MTHGTVQRRRFLAADPEVRGAWAVAFFLAGFDEVFLRAAPSSSAWTRLGKPVLTSW